MIFVDQEQAYQKVHKEVAKVLKEKGSLYDSRKIHMNYYSYWVTLRINFKLKKPFLLEFAKQIQGRCHRICFSLIIPHYSRLETH